MFRTCAGGERQFALTAFDPVAQIAVAVLDERRKLYSSVSPSCWM